MTRTGMILAIASLALLPGCASTYVSPVEVTRFVGEQPQQLGSGTIAVRAAAGSEADSLEFAAYRSAVAAELARLGYSVTDGDAAQIAEVSVERSVTQQPRGRSPVSVGVGGSTGSYGSGVGLGVGFDLSGPPPEQVGSQMRVIIRPAAGGMALWEGRASFNTTVKSPYAEAPASAAKLAAALFAGFPGSSGETITVK